MNTTHKNNAKDNKSSYHIRLMKTSDLPFVMKIEREIFSEPWRDRLFRQIIEINEAFVLEDSVSLEVLGFICGSSILNDYSLMNIAVTKDYQDKGLATVLLSYLIDKITHEGYRSCYLEVRESNAKAINLYQKFGFYIIGKKKEYYYNPIEDALVMRLLL